MIDPKDTATGDLVGNLPKRRGRPPTGKAKSGSERMKALRTRSFLNGDESSIPTGQLYERLAEAHRFGHSYNFEALVLELRKRLKSSL